MKVLHPKIEEYRKYNGLMSFSDSPIIERAITVEKRIAKGYGVMWSSINDHRERFVKGAFSKSISENGPESKSAYKIKFRDRHQKSVCLFEKLDENKDGLLFETKEFDNVSWANDLIEQIRSGTINNYSIGFRPMWDRVEWDDENDCLVVIESQLFEISAVDIPSDKMTHSVRSIEETEEIEGFILCLPRDKQLHARQLFTRFMSPADDSPLYAPVKSTPAKQDIDFNYLIKKLKR